jgi:ribonuclease HII
MEWSQNMNNKGEVLRGVAGIDEAGRGPMIGPLVVAGVLVREDELSRLEASGVRDSKTLSPKRRAILADVIAGLVDKTEIRVVTAAEIDGLRRRGVSLNEIEVQQFVSVLSTLRPKTAYLDAADVKADRFGAIIGDRSELATLGCKIISEHKADSKFPIVSAASIIAKEERERIIAGLHQEYGDFGSGYPSDPKSIDFIRRLIEDGEKLPPIVRKSWESVKRLQDDSETTQQTLDV